MSRKPRLSTFEQNISTVRQQLTASIISTPPGPEREALERKLAQLENAAMLAASFRPNIAVA